MQITSPQHRFQSWLLAYCWKYWYGWRLKIPPHGCYFTVRPPWMLFHLYEPFIIHFWRVSNFVCSQFWTMPPFPWCIGWTDNIIVMDCIYLFCLSYSYNIAWRTCAHTPAPTRYTTIASPHQSPGMVLMSTTQRPTMLCGTHVERIDVPTASPNLVTSCHLLWVCPQLLQNYICEGKIERSPQSSWKIQSGFLQKSLHRPKIVFGTPRIRLSILLLPGLQKSVYQFIRLSPVYPMYPITSSLLTCTWLPGHAWPGTSSSRGLNIRICFFGFSMTDGVRHYMGFNGIIYGNVIAGLSINGIFRNQWEIFERGPLQMATWWFQDGWDLILQFIHQSTTLRKDEKA